MTEIDLTTLTFTQKRELLAQRLRDRATNGPRRYPVSFGQRRMWFLERLSPGNAAYNIPGALDLRGDLDTGLFRACVDDLVARHAILRTTFAEVDGDPVQVVHPTGSADVSVVDAPELDDPDRLTALATAEFARPFDLAAGPLLRMRFLRVAPQRHVLLLTMHHIVGDLWSTSVALRDLFALYRSRRDGGTPPATELPPLGIQYHDFAAWQSSRHADDTVRADLDHWEQRLADAPAHLELPTDRPRPPVHTTRGGSTPASLSAPLTRRLADLAAAESATPFAAALAVFATLLHRYSQADDLVIGVPVAGRDRREVDDLIGLFVDMVPLRVNLAESPSFRDVLRRTRDTTRDGFAHQAAPFEQIVARVSPHRDPSITPVFQVSFMYQNIALPDFAGIGLVMRPIDVPATTARFDLTLELFESENGLSGRFEYNRDLFDPETIEHLAEHFTALTTSVLADPDAPVSAARLADAAAVEVDQARCNDTATVWDGPTDPLARFERWVARTPDAAAVSDAAGTLTYADLDRRVALLSDRIRAHVPAGGAVGVYAPRTAELAIALLAALRAGTPYVPMDPGFPAERVRYAFADAGVVAALTDATGAPAIESLGVAPILLDTDTETDTAGPAADPAPGGTRVPELAYTIYTSGSTGRPKGVRIRRTALGNFLRSMAQRPGLHEAETLVAVTTPAFDIAVLELLGPLTTGGHVVVADAESTIDGHRLARLIDETRADVVQATPVTWTVLLDAGWEPRPGFRALIGGEALPPALAQRLTAAGVQVWNMYGPTETTVWSAVSEITGSGITLGEPIANTDLHVLDDHGEILPDGVPGELAIGGHGLADGYHGRPDLTAKAFVRHPLRAGDAIYRTGDLVRRAHDGRLWFLGRLDHQVKLRGYRIELGEIEAVLAEQDGVREAAVAVAGSGTEARLVAYVVLDDPAAGDDPYPGLRDALGDKLPRYMVPTDAVLLRRLPRTPNGKLDRRALPSPGDGAGRTARDVTAPRDAVEEVVAGVWADVLNLADLGVHESFFDLGGHSVLSTRITARLRDLFDVDIPLARMFAEPTVAGVAATLRRIGDDDTVRRTGELLIELAADDRPTP